MIFDPKSGALFADDGKFLKTVRCPLAIKSEQLSLLTPGGPDRFCHSCKKTIRNIDEWTDEQAQAAVELDRELCVFATSKAKNIVFLGSTGTNYSYERMFLDEDQQFVRIQTMRSLEAMADAEERGFELIFGDTGIDNDFGDVKYILYRNRTTGKLYWTGDYREMVTTSAALDKDSSAKFELIQSWFWVRSDKPFPLAAYAVPKELPVGTRVFLDDLIEDVLEQTRNQGCEKRVNAWPATWNGKTFDVDPPYKSDLVG